MGYILPWIAMLIWVSLGLWAGSQLSAHAIKGKIKDLILENPTITGKEILERI